MLRHFTPFSGNNCKSKLFAKILKILLLFCQKKLSWKHSFHSWVVLKCGVTCLTDCQVACWSNLFFPRIASSFVLCVCVSAGGLKGVARGGLAGLALSGAYALYNNWEHLTGSSSSSRLYWPHTHSFISTLGPNISPLYCSYPQCWGGWHRLYTASMSRFLLSFLPRWYVEEKRCENGQDSIANPDKYRPWTPLLIFRFSPHWCSVLRKLCEDL